jgi:arylsulfatase A-like enzyme
VETIINLYDASVRYVDDNIGQLLSNLGDDLHNTIVIITADHGDEFGEHGSFSHWTLYDGVIHVPLIMTGPRIRGGTVVREQVSLIDLAPTIADFAGIGSPPGFYGRSLRPRLRGGRKGTEGVISITGSLLKPGGDSQQMLLSYRTPGWKYILTESGTSPETVLSEELYNLRDDPGEMANLNSLETKERRNFKREALKAISLLKQAKVKELTISEMDRVKRRVKKLPNL